MPMQPYQSQELAPAGADRIHIPVSGPPHGAPPQPSLVTVFAQEAWKRKKLLFVWLAVTAALTAAVVLKFAQPLYRAEGKFAYQPNYSRGPKPIYTPPNIQSAVQILKSSETLDPVRAKHLPDLSADEFSKNVRVEVSKQSEFIDVSYDHPDPKVAEAIASDLMQEGLKTFTNVRVRTTKDTIVQVRNDLERSKRRLEEAKQEYFQAHNSRGVVDPQSDLLTIQTGIMDVNRQLRAAREEEVVLKAKIKTFEAQKDKPGDAADASLDEHFFPNLQAQMAKLQTELLNQEKLDAARISLDAAKRKELEYRPGYTRGIIPRNEYEDVLKEIRIHEATLKRAEEMKLAYDEVKKQFDELKEKAKKGKQPRRALMEDLERWKAELDAVPTKMAGLTAELEEKKKAQADLIALQKELGPKDEEIRLLRTRMQDFDAQLTDAAERGQDLNANDLRIHSAAAAGTSPYSTNAPKLGLAIVGASALLFIGYIVLFALPRFVPGSPAGLAGAPAGALPRALVALVPYTQPAKANGTQPSEPVATPMPAEATVAAAAQANGSHSGGPNEPTDSGEAAEPATAEPVAAEPPVRYRHRPTRPIEVVPQPPAADPAPVEVLAERIAEDWMDQGGIVLFTPTADELKVAPAIGDLGRIFTKRGDRVLVFDARHDAENPSWAGPRAPEVARTVEGFLDGRADATAECFVPTNLNGVEYSRADLSTRVAGVMAAHRFRQLVEQMRERYSLVFLVGPPVTLDGSDPMLATLAEGMVLVTESTADLSEVHAYLDALSHQVPTRVYGTLAVPRV